MRPLKGDGVKKFVDDFGCVNYTRQSIRFSDNLKVRCMAGFELILYEDSRGKVPFKEWISSLKDVKGQQIILARLERLKHGLFGDAKPLVDTDGILELRVDFGPGYRVYYALAGKTVVILLGGGTKKSQHGDIKKVSEYFSDLKERR